MCRGGMYFSEILMPEKIMGCLIVKHALAYHSIPGVSHRNDDNYVVFRQTCFSDVSPVLRSHSLHDW